MWSYNQTSELYHHGIKGQKWGIRKYQNEDGSLTEAGKKRYYTSKYLEGDPLAKLKAQRKYLKDANKSVNKYSKAIAETKSDSKVIERKIKLLEAKKKSFEIQNKSTSGVQQKIIKNKEKIKRFEKNIKTGNENLEMTINNILKRGYDITRFKDASSGKSLSEKGKETVSTIISTAAKTGMTMFNPIAGAVTTLGTTVFNSSYLQPDLTTSTKYDVYRVETTKKKRGTYGKIINKK